jgi:putative sigma-54 modulation protein
MIKHIDIAAAQKDYKIDADLSKYIQKKIGKLDKHIKKDYRAEARADVKLKESSGKDGKKCTAEVILHIPGTKLTASESTLNMYAAIDIVEHKLQNQLKREKEKKDPAKDKHLNGRARQAIGKIFSRK